MAVRTDISVDWNLSPRLITVEAPSVSLTIQDLLDTLRVIEDDTRGMSEPYLISAGGKESLGGGQTVGITATLQNAQVRFQSRTSASATGTHTGANDSTTQLVDSAADFVTAGVTRGTQVVNFTDNSVTDVVDVIDANTLLLASLTGGTDNDFDTGDYYHLYNVVSVAVRGGNLVAVDDDGIDIEPILPSFGTRVTRELSTSAVGIQSGSGLSVDQDARITLIERILRNKMITDPSTGLMELYTDDGSSVMMSCQLYEDSAGMQNYRGQGAEHRGRMG